MENNKSKKESIKENTTLVIGAIANLIMAIYAWITYYYSNSEAILLDGNYSFVMFLGVLIALRIATIKARKNKKFPDGQFFYEALYGFLKGLSILGILLTSVATALARIFMYFYGASDKIPMLIPDPILHYGLVCAAICYGISFYYHLQNRSLGNTSIMLKAEQKSTFVDGTLSLGIAMGVFFLTKGGSGIATGFVPYLADSFFVLILALSLIKEPIHIIRESLIELGGGSLTDLDKRKMIDSAILSIIPNSLKVKEVLISKKGSLYTVLIYVSTDQSSFISKEIFDLKDKLIDCLSKDFSHLTVTIVPDKD